MRFSLASDLDLPEVIGLAERCGDGPHWSPDVWSGFTEQGTTVALQRVLMVLRSGDGTLAGWLAGSLLDTVAELEYLLIDAHERGKGLGTELLNHWLAWVTERGGTEVFLEVRASNVKARSLYQACGFEQQGLRRGYYSKPVEDAIVMRLAIPAGLSAQPS